MPESSSSLHRSNGALAYFVLAAPPGAEIQIAIRVPAASPPPAAEESSTNPVDGGSRWTAEAVVEWGRANGDSGTFKLIDWAGMLRQFGISYRELRRAADQGMIRAERKGKHRDHGALICHADEIAAYLLERPCRASRGQSLDG
jgi:hypothetical protein